MKHFLKETDFGAREVAEIFDLARSLKEKRTSHPREALANQSWALIFSKSSTRTRVSFEVGIRELGGNALFLNRNDIQLGRGETIADSARVLSRFLHGLVVRTFDHSDVEELARWGAVPVINALTDFLHPCQIYTDAFTAAERWAQPGGDLLASLKGKKIAFLGDTCFNMANSWILGSAVFGMKLALAGPESHAPRDEIKRLVADDKIPTDYIFTTDPEEAVRGADIIYTDVWASMGQEEESDARIAEMSPYAVTDDLFAKANPDALFMHCLPAHPGEEVEQAVLDNPRSIVFDQAENRLHVQKAIMAVLGRQTKIN